MNQTSSNTNNNNSSSTQQQQQQQKQQQQELPVENIRPTQPKHLQQGPYRMAHAFVNAFQSTGRRRPQDVQLAKPTSNNHLGGEWVDGKNAKFIKTKHVRLITIGISHYCEKVRWALDLLEADPTSPIYYTEDAHPPALAALSTVPASHGAASMTPMVILDNSDNDEDKKGNDEALPPNVLYDSSRILQTLTPSLYPPTTMQDNNNKNNNHDNNNKRINEEENEILAFENYLDAHLGPTVRCFLYHHMLSPPYVNTLADSATRYTSTIETWLFKTMMKQGDVDGGGLSKGMRRAMGIHETSAQKSLEEIRNVFEVVSEKLEYGRRVYLFDHLVVQEEEEEEGAFLATTTTNPPAYTSTSNYTHTFKPGFTAADLTFAALASPLLMPKELLCLQFPQNNNFNHNNNKLPPSLLQISKELRDTPAGKHVLRMYHCHRLDGCFLGQFGSRGSLLRGVPPAPAPAGAAPPAASSSSGGGGGNQAVAGGGGKCAPLCLRQVVPKSTGRNVIPKTMVWGGVVAAAAATTVAIVTPLGFRAKL